MTTFAMPSLEVEQPTAREDEPLADSPQEKAAKEADAAVIEEIAGDGIVPLDPAVADLLEWAVPCDPVTQETLAAATAETPAESIPEAPALSARNSLALLYEIEEAEKACRRAESEVENLKELLKAAKEVYEDAVAGLRKIAGNVAGALEADREEGNLPIFRLIETNLATGKVEIGPESNAPLTVGLAGDPLAPPAEPAQPSQDADTSVEWPEGMVPWKIVCLIDSEILKVSSGDEYDVEIDEDGVFIDDSTCLMRGDFRVTEWRKQEAEDKIPRFVARWRASFERKLLQEGDEVELSVPPEAAPIAAETSEPDDTDLASARAYPVAFLTITDAVAQALNAANLLTVGNLIDYIASGKSLTDLNKIGKLKADKIESALALFWERRPDRTNQPPL